MTDGRGGSQTHGKRSGEQLRPLATPVVTLGEVGLEDHLDSGPQVRDVFGRRDPNDGPGQAEVLMDHDIPKSHDLGPGDLGMTPTRLQRDPHRGLADHGQLVQQHRRPSGSIGHQDCDVPSGDVADDCVGSLDDVQQEEPVWPHREFATPRGHAF